MTSVTLCACGCGEPAVWADRHFKRMARRVLSEADYTVEDRGYETPCWISVIKGAKDGSGYVMARVNNKPTLAHRAMYEQARGPIPEGLWLDHLCRQKRCMRPDHLEPVTPAVNRQRRMGAKLTLAQATEIKGARGSQRAVDLARQYGVVVSLIYAIWAEKIWKNA